MRVRISNAFQGRLGSPCRLLYPNGRYSDTNRRNCGFSGCDTFVRSMVRGKASRYEESASA
ncbi:MAG: hypothetical protein F4058_07240 [Rhodothermaceae bacterium]|nr:hypothetical protein [Rhodothermaceae bacterium]MYF63720.1 hypothetical protein [Rhodothermaceae bacterium]MYI85115.1 hypothetical protein [Rhodothermaceae bacterium]